MIGESRFDRHRRRAEELLDLIHASNIPLNAADTLAAARAHAHLAQIALGERVTTMTEASVSDRSELEELRRIVAEHIHAIQSITAGPVRKLLGEKLARPLLDALDASGISLTGELLDVAGEALQAGSEQGGEDEPDVFVPRQRDAEQQDGQDDVPYVPAYRADRQIGLTLGTYRAVEDAQAHCEDDARQQLPLPTDAQLRWYGDTPDDTALRLYITADGEESETDYTVSPLTVQAAYDPNAEG